MKLSKEKKKQLVDEAILLYVIDSLTLKEIGNKLKISERSIADWLKPLKIELDNPENREAILKKVNRINYQIAIAHIFQGAKRENRQLTAHELNAINIYNLNLENNK